MIFLKIFFKCKKLLYSYKNGKIRSEGILLKKNLSKLEKRQAFSAKATESIVKTMKKAIKDRRVRDETVSMIRALDLKKIRNTSKT